MPVISAPALYVFPSDLLDEGVTAVVERSIELGTTLAVAMAYHQARDLVPHAGSKPRIRYRQDGVFFEPDAFWPPATPLPRVQSLQERTAVRELLDRDDLPRPEAWTVFLHNTGLGQEQPELATLTCFGDSILSNLCPSNPTVSDYADALASAVSSLGMDIIAEALSAQTFAHGSHHERAFSPLGEGEQAMLGICFCEHCLQRAAAHEVDGESVAERAREHLQRAFASERATPATRESLAESLGEEVLTYLGVREQAVSELTGRVAATVHGAGKQLSFMDLTGAVLGYDSGMPSGALAAEHAWRLSIDPAAAAGSADSYTILGYTRDPERLSGDVASYRAAVGSAHLRVILRPGHPDASSAAQLRDHVAAAREGGADQIDFYNYGMYDQAVLDRIPTALA